MRRFGLILREVSQGLRRSWTMTLAVILTVAVSLTLLGTGLLVRKQVETMKDYWYDRVQVSVFMCGKASDIKVCPAGAVTAPERDAIKAVLESLRPTVEEVFYESQQEAFDRFKQQFKNSPILDNVTPDSLPESFRVKLVNAEDFSKVTLAVGDLPGVEQVQDQRKLLEKFFKLLNGLQLGAIGVALAMLLVTILLVINTMRVAAFSRRRETGIMKLVGASNMYIRMPFVLEAAISAGIGGLIAVGAIAAQKYFLINQVLEPSFKFTAFVGWRDVIHIMGGVFVFGILLAAISAWLAVRRYLRV
jgi:cell division transport system permease protein